MMKMAKALLFILALAIGGGLRYILLQGSEPLNMSIFAVACVLLGEVFHQIDKKISKK